MRNVIDAGFGVVGNGRNAGKLDFLEKKSVMRKTTIFYIVSPSFLMISMALIATYGFPLFFGSSHALYFNQTDTMIESLISFAWVVFISFRLRNRPSRFLFFAWWPILAILCIVLLYVSGALMGLPIGREERFPAVVVMLPTIGLLLFISFLSLVFCIVKKE